MSSRSGQRTRHEPKRTCVGCRQILPKRSLVRIVRGKDGVTLDPTGRAPGRGAYLHDQVACWSSALEGSLEKALRVELTPNENMELSAFMENLEA